MESCILPCSFQGDTDVIIHWNQVTAGNSPVHSFYYNKDQLTQQDQRFSGRTSVFKDQIPGGNASLQLTGLQVQDQGRYKCYTVDGEKHTEHHLSVFVLVQSPVGKVDLQQVGNRITCSSEGIYPEPELTWSTSPPSTVTFKSQAEVQETEQLLYNISSSLTIKTSLKTKCLHVGCGSLSSTAKVVYNEEEQMGEFELDVRSWGLRHVKWIRSGNYTNRARDKWRIK
uniref:Ig-like domain-containing protein n=1 Tax=Seriola dumerili TaxID=41447 RepID=A0A3B4U3D0_SERDU